MDKLTHLDHLLGNLPDKLSSLSKVPQPLLSEMIRDLSSYPMNFQESTTPGKTISIKQLYIAALSNPNLSEENYLSLTKVLFDFNLYCPYFLPDITFINLEKSSFFKFPVFKITLEHIWKNTNGKKYSSNHALNSMVDYLSNKAKTDRHEEELFSLFENQQKKLLKEISSDVLVSLNSGYRLKMFFKLFLVNILPNKTFVSAEIATRKHPTPKEWKKYNSKNFMSLFTTTNGILHKLKLNRRSFFTKLKNRVISPAEIKSDSEAYLKLLDQAIAALEDQKKDIKSRIKDLPTQDNLAEPDSCEVSD